MKPTLAALVVAPFMTLTFSCGEADASSPSSPAVGKTDGPGVDPLSAVAGLFGDQGLSGLVEFRKSGEALEAIKELREKAEQEMQSDPGAAVDALATMARLGRPGPDMFQAMREASIQGLQTVLEQVPDAQRSLQLGKELFLAGLFEEAQDALDSALESGLPDPGETVAALCWSGATALVLGDEGGSARTIEQARQTIAAAQARAQAKAQAQAQASRERMARLRELQELSGDGLPSPNPYGLAPTSPDGTMLGLGRGQSLQGSGGGGVSSAVAREYHAALAAYQAEEARYQSELDYANSRAGRYGALGIQINPQPVDQQVYLRYLNAKTAYEAGGR